MLDFGFEVWDWVYLAFVLGMIFILWFSFSGELPQKEESSNSDCDEKEGLSK